MELEKKKKQDLLNQKNHEQEAIVHLKSKKRSLELELEAVVRTKPSSSSVYKAVKYCMNLIVP